MAWPLRRDLRRARIAPRERAERKQLIDKPAAGIVRLRGLDLLAYRHSPLSERDRGDPRLRAHSARPIHRRPHGAAAGFGQPRCARRGLQRSARERAAALAAHAPLAQTHNERILAALLARRAVSGGAGRASWTYQTRDGSLAPSVVRLHEHALRHPCLCRAAHAALERGVGS